MGGCSVAEKWCRRPQWLTDPSVQNLRSESTWFLVQQRWCLLQFLMLKHANCQFWGFPCKMLFPLLITSTSAASFPHPRLTGMYIKKKNWKTDFSSGGCGHRARCPGGSHSVFLKFFVKLLWLQSTLSLNKPSPLGSHTTYCHPCPSPARSSPTAAEALHFVFMCLNIKSGLAVWSYCS